VSFAAPFIQLAKPASGLTVASLRVVLAGAAFWLAAPGALRQFAGLAPRERWLVVLAGALLGAHFGVWTTSLHFTSTASSVTLVATQPMFAALLGGMLLGDTVTRREIAGIALATVGVALLAGGDLRVSGRALIGDGLALAGAATASAAFVVSRRMRASIPLAPYLALVNLCAAAVLVPAALIAGEPFTGFEPSVYAAIAGCTVVASLIGHTLLNWSVRRTPAHLVTLGILGESVGATLLSWALVSEQPPASAALGGAVILVGIGVGFSGRKS